MFKRFWIEIFTVIRLLVASDKERQLISMRSGIYRDLHFLRRNISESTKALTILRENISRRKGASDNDLKKMIIEAGDELSHVSSNVSELQKEFMDVYSNADLKLLEYWKTKVDEETTRVNKALAMVSRIKENSTI